MKALYGFGSLLALVVVPTAALASPVSMPSFAQALAAATGNPVVPAAWAGIWQFADSTHDCGSSIITETSVEVDTLCTGEPVGNSGPGIDCSGPVDDTSVNVTCTYTEVIFEGCDVTLQQTIAGTRTGDTFYVEMTFSTTYVPTGCASLPDECTVTEITATRLAPEPTPCSTVVVSDSWGRTKALYR
jgi:hypothetical protein